MRECDVWQAQQWTERKLTNRDKDSLPIVAQRKLNRYPRLHLRRYSCLFTVGSRNAWYYGILSEQNSREEKEKAVMSHFLETVRQKENGRYENQCLPFWARFGDLKPIRVTSDIEERAFLQISLHEKDRGSLRADFSCMTNEVVIYELPGDMPRDAFGATSSSFLLTAAINYHLLKATVQKNVTPEEFLKKLQDSFLRRYLACNP
ncbi:hypothetical protein TNCV_3036861 [Trichonephila clavipes]|nr:hypothetical protein TNCV_3036861 [Trichonephila clavipes]